MFGGDLYLAPFPPTDMTGIRYPDMLIAFDADPEAYRRSNGYIVSEQGKPPDFVLEIGSPSTGRVDVGEKRDDYEALGIPEYWRFDETGRSHGVRAGRGPAGGRGSIDRLTLRSWRRTCCRATVRSCSWTCAGNTGS